MFSEVFAGGGVGTDSFTLSISNISVSKPVRLGIIGCGGYAFQLIKRLWTLPQFAEIVGVAFRPSDEGFQACDEEGIPLFETVDDLLDYGQGRFDAIINPTPIHLHKPITVMCLEAGFPVFMEKPPVAVLEEHLSLIQASRKAGLPVAVCFNSIFSSGSQKLKRELLAGRYGRLLRIRNLAGWIRSQSYFRRSDWAGRLRMGGSWVLDGTINNPLSHLIASSLHFAGADLRGIAEPDVVQAELYRGNTIESEDTSSVRIITQEGVEILNNLTLCAENLIDMSTTIECEDATITITGAKQTQISFSNGRKEIRKTYCEDRIEMLMSLCAAIRSGERFLCDIESTLPFTRTINAAFHSSWPVRQVPSSDIEQSSGNDDTNMRIVDINAFLSSAHEQGKLLSEIGVPWATAGRTIAVNGSISASRLD